MKKGFTKCLLLCSVLLTVSCATIVSGSRQKINFISTPDSATVFINEIEVGKTPLEQNLKRNQNYDVLIKLDGYEPYTTQLTKKFNAWYIGNIAFGGIIGLIVDPATGAMFKLSATEIDAKFSSKTALKFKKHNNVYVAVSLDVDPTWQKVGQLSKLN